jgi:hypothetical protein
MKLKPERVLRERDDVSLIEVLRQFDDGRSELAGYYVYGGRGDSSILHESIEAAEGEFLRRSAREAPGDAR